MISIVVQCIEIPYDMHSCIMQWDCYTYDKYTCAMH